MSWRLAITLCFAILSVSIARAEDQMPGELDPAEAEGLKKTMELLRNPKLREQAAAADPKAAGAMSDARKATGNDPKNEQEIFEQAAVIFDSLVKETHGDPQKLQAAIAELQRNPSALESRLNSDQKQRLSTLANKVANPPVSAGAH